MIKYNGIFNSKDIWSLSLYARGLVELSMLMFYTKSEAIFSFYLSLSHWLEQSWHDNLKSFGRLHTRKGSTAGEKYIFRWRALRDALKIALGN